jgi:hypothetical protein
MENWKMVTVIPKTIVSPRGNLILMGVVGYYEIIVMTGESFYPLTDIVLHLN